MAQCIATTKKGSQCKRNALEGESYCGIHVKSVQTQNEETQREETQTLSQEVPTVRSNLSKLVNENSPLTGLIGFLSLFPAIFFSMNFFEIDEEFFNFILSVGAIVLVSALVGFALDTLFKSVFGKEKYLNFMEASGDILRLVFFLAVVLLFAYIGFALGSVWYTKILFAIIGAIIGIFFAVS